MKKKIIKIKIVVLVSVITLNTLFFPFSARAGAWGEPIQAAILKQAMEEAYYAFKDSMVASLKITASRLIKDRLEALLLGKSSRPLYITDYEDFLFLQPQNRAQVLVDDYFNSITSNVSVATRNSLIQVESAIDAEIFGLIDTTGATIDEYVQGGLDYVFDQTKGGGLTAFNAAFDNPYNNPYGAYVYSSELALNKIEREKKIASDMAIAGGGYVGKVDPETNLIQLPGSTLRDLAATAESLPMQIVAFARSIPEVIGTVAAEVLTQTIQTGIYKVTEPIDNQLRDIHYTVEGGYHDVQRDIYNGIKFTD